MKTKARWRVVPFSIVAFVAISAETRASGAETPGVTASLRADREINPRMESDFIAFDPDYRKKKAERVLKARSLGKQVIAREQAGQNTQLSHQILSEIIWLISS